MRLIVKTPDAPAPVVESVYIPLSMEEEAIQEAEFSEALVGTQASLDNADALAATADGITDTLIIVDKTPIISVIDNSLLNTVADMATAGSDLDPTDIVPAVAMESEMANYEHPTYHKLGEDGEKDGSSGTLSEKLKKMWEAILQFLKGAWESFTKFLTYFYASAEKLKHEATSALAEAKALTNITQPKNPTFTMVDSWGATFVNGKSFVMQNSNTITPEQLVTNFEKAVAMLTKQAPEQQKKIGEEIEHLLNSYDPVKPSDSVKDSALRIRDGMIDYANKLVHMAGDVKSSATDTLEGSALMGNFTITAKNVPAKNGSGEDDAAAVIEEVTKLRFGINAGLPFAADPVAYTMPSIAPGNAVRELVKYDQIADALLDYKNRHFAEVAKKSGDAIRSVSEKIAHNNHAVGSDSARVASALLKFNNAYANWSMQPTMAAMHRICRTCLFFVSSHKKSLAQYK